MQKRQYIVTERAHLMCPNMYFGIKCRVRADYDSDRLQDTLRTLAKAHPFLKCVIGREDDSGKLYYDFHEELQIPIYEKTNTEAWSGDYQELMRNGWDAFHEGLLKVIVYPSQGDFDVILIAHHLLGDGRGILGLACEFADCYVTGRKPAYVEERLISSMQDLPKGSDLPWVSKVIVNSANKNWRQENHAVSYAEYLEFEKQFIKDNPIQYTEETIDVEAVEDMLGRCRNESVTLNDYLVAEMMCREQCDKVVIAADIRKQLACYCEGALGNYATAMGIVSNVKSTDSMVRARDVAKKIRAHRADPKKLMLILACYLHMIPELLDAVPIATLGTYESKAGKFVGSVMFGYEKRDGYSITNLGNVENPNLLEAMFIPPVSPASKKIMGVLSVNGRMKKCSAVYE